MEEKIYRKIADNKQARFNFQFHEFLEVGLELTGTEVKSLRLGKVNFKDSFVFIKDLELWLQGLHIDTYAFGNRENHLTERQRKILAHKKEIMRFSQKIKEKNYTIVPVRLFFKGRWAKLEIALASGKKEHDKRQTILERDQKKHIARTLKNYR